MMFQFGGSAVGVLQTLQNWGVFDALLPFLLLFTLMFAILTKVGIFKNDRKIAGVVAGAIAALIVVPHVIGGVYPAGFDPINIINQMLPSAGILLVAILLVLMMLGLVGGKQDGGGLMSWVVGIAMIILLLSIVSAIWPSIPILKYLTADASVLALLIVLLVFGLIVWFVTKDDTKKPETTRTKMLENLIWGEVPPSKPGGG